jgi:membrane protein implicated in regulation of membrane protease activity
MKNVDWPLALTLAIIFVVTSVVRWRYFRRRMAKRREAGRPDERTNEERLNGR